MFTGVLQEGRDGPPRLHKRGWWFFESPSKALWPGVNREGSLLLGGRPKTDRYMRLIKQKNIYVSGRNRKIKTFC